MEDPNITMEEYIKLEEEKARRHGKVYNWETPKYGRIRYDDDVHDLRSVETEFPAIVFNDKLTSEEAFSCEPTYIDADIVDFETRLGKIYKREVHRVHVFDFRGLTDLMAEGLRGPLVHELILEFFSTFRFREAVLDLDTAGALQFQLGGVRRRMSRREFILGMGLHTTEEIESVRFGAYWAESARQIPDKGDLSAYWREISSAGDFFGTTPSYTSIRDSMLRLCHRQIACSIAGRSQAPEKVTMIDLFYLRGMDVGSVNIHYLLARYLMLFASGRKQGAMISEAPGPERQPDAAAGAPRAADPAPVQAPQPPFAAPKTIL
ncbi:hypothetical protein Tco_0808995 [Tanacetum coccineum]